MCSALTRKDNTMVETAAPSDTVVNSDKQHNGGVGTGPCNLDKIISYAQLNVCLNMNVVLCKIQKCRVY